jgi:hypothetical protein
MTFGLPPDEQFLAIRGQSRQRPASATAVTTSCGIGRRTSDQIKWLLTDDHGVTHAISIPPPLIPRQAIAEMRADAERLVAPQFRQIVRLIEDRSCSRSTISSRPAWPSAGWRSWVTQHS